MLPEKGSTVFRPITKPRPRAGGDSRQVSAAPETSSPSSFGNPSSLLHNETGSSARISSSMPPPSLTSHRQPASAVTPAESSATESSKSYEIPPEESGSIIDPGHAILRNAAPPSIAPSIPSRPSTIVPLREAIPNMATAINVPSRHTSVPLVLPKSLSSSPNAPSAHRNPSSSRPPTLLASLNEGAPVATTPLSTDIPQIDPALLEQITQ